MNARGVNKVTSSTKRDQQGAAEDAWSSEKDNNYQHRKCHEITMKGKRNYWQTDTLLELSPLRFTTVAFSIMVTIFLAVQV